MRSFVKKLTNLLLMVLFIVSLTGCNSHTYEKSESLIVPTKNLQTYIGQEKVVIVDMQAPEDYSKGHVSGAVNIPTEEIMINVPVKNMLTSKKKIEKLMGANGISNDTLVIAYDTNNMSASRLLWSLFMYGHENVKVVDGGLSAIKAANITLTTDVPTPAAATFTAKDPSQNWLAKKEDVLEQVNHPDSNTILLDVRTDEEYYTVGKVPTSIMMSHTNNFYSTDNTFKSVETTKINYLESKIYPENEVIIYCQTSMRAAPVFVQLYEAGYRNLRIYDGAFLEWSSNSDNPIEIPEGAAPPVNKDAS